MYIHRHPRIHNVHAQITVGTMSWLQGLPASSILLLEFPAQNAPNTSKIGSLDTRADGASSQHSEADPTRLHGDSDSDSIVRKRPRIGTQGSYEDVHVGAGGVARACALPSERGVLYGYAVVWILTMMWFTYWSVSSGGGRAAVCRGLWEPLCLVCAAVAWWCILNVLV
jgi:hypothetical protein